MHVNSVANTGAHQLILALRISGGMLPLPGALATLSLAIRLVISETETGGQSGRSWDAVCGIQCLDCFAAYRPVKYSSQVLTGMYEFAAPA